MNNHIYFNPTEEGFKEAKEWAEKQPSPTKVQDNLWEWANAISKDSFEIVSIVNREFSNYVKNLNESNFEL